MGVRVPLTFAALCFVGIVTLLIMNGWGSHIVFLFSGVVGATLANSTGAGGGVVFIPLFQQLNISTWEAVGTSFAIQWFGMSVGASRWSMNYQQKKSHDPAWSPLPKIVAICTGCSIAGIWISYGFQIEPPVAVHSLFGIFSIFFGLMILITIGALNNSENRVKVGNFDYLLLALISLVGGVITAWISVGVGELLVVYLIFRGYHPIMAIASAVIVSALTVWSAMPQFIWFNPVVDWGVVGSVAPGAVIGALCAVHLVNFIGARRLKLYFAFCLLLIGLVSI